MTTTKTAAEALGLTSSDIIAEDVPAETTPGALVPATGRLFTDEELLNLTADTFSALLTSKGLSTSDAGALGNGFALVKGDDEKRKLIGTPLYLLGWQRRTDSDTGNVFYSMEILTRDNRKLIMNDGSTGIAAQLEMADARGVKAPMLVVKGFRVSDYVVEVDGKPTKASTFYLDTTPATQN